MSHESRYSAPSPNKIVFEGERHRGTDRFVEMSDGARLHFVTVGQESNPRTNIVVFNGNPSVAKKELLHHDAMNELGVRVISHTRRGYYKSTGSPHIYEHPSSWFWDLAQDTEEITEALGANTSLVVGSSGGVPHALAYASRYPERVNGVVLLAPFLPNSMLKDSDQGATSGLFNAGPNAGIEGMIQHELFAHLQRLSFLIEKQHSIGSYELTEFPPGMNSDAKADITALGFPVQRALHESYKWAIRNGIDGWFHDVWGLYHDWGFDLQKVKAPVIIQSYKGDNYGKDGKALARLLPYAVAFEDEGSHFWAFKNRLQYMRILHAYNTGDTAIVQNYYSSSKWGDRMKFFESFVPFMPSLSRNQ
jgi:pimeloyl-ACP methyl ester carboxylesterase